MYFRSPADRRDFAAAAIDAGFIVQSEIDHDAEGTERRYYLNIVRTDLTTLEHIDAVVVQLLELLERYDADYDGWGCEVETGAVSS